MISLFIRRFLTLILSPLFGFLIPIRYRIILINLRIAFPKLSYRERIALRKKSVRATIFSILSLGKAWNLDKNYATKTIRVSGDQHIYKAREEGKPIIILLAHMVYVDLIGIALALHLNFKMHATYKKAKNKFMNALMIKQRNKYFASSFEVQNMKNFIGLLKNKETVIFIPDQGISANRNSVPSNFMGISIPQWSTHLRIAKITGARMIPVIGTRLGLSDRCELTVLPPLEIEEQDPINIQVEQSMYYVEQSIAFAPNQYLWTHRRFKSSAKFYQ